MTAALKLVEMPAPVIRRFNSADLTKHGAWILPRLIQSYPHMNERAAATFLQNIMWNNEYLLLYSETGVALAQIMLAHSLDANLKDPNEFAGWIFANSDEHKQAADILGIG